MGKREVPAHEAQTVNHEVRSAKHEVQSANVLLGHGSIFMLQCPITYHYSNFLHKHGMYSKIHPYIAFNNLPLCCI